MIGILYGIINFNNYDTLLQSLNLQNNTRLVIIDKNGVKIGDSNENDISISKEFFDMKEQFSNLSVVKFALEGKSGSILEKINGIKSQITFLPYDIFQTREFYYLFKVATALKMK